MLNEITLLLVWRNFSILSPKARLFIAAAMLRWNFLKVASQSKSPCILQAKHRYRCIVLLFYFP